MKNEKPKHTPLPWVSEPVRMSGRGKHSIFRPCITADSKIIADLVWPGFSAMNAEKEERKANAAFIVEACNNHDRLEAVNAELLAALEAWIKVESEMGYNHPCPNLSLRARYRDEAKRLTRAAIAKAKGGI